MAEGGGVLRQLLAEFTIAFDRAGEMLRGNQAVDNLKAKLTDLQGIAAKPIILPKVIPPAMPGVPGGALANFKQGFNESSGLAGFTGKLNALRLGLVGLGGGLVIRGLTNIVDHIGEGVLDYALVNTNRAPASAIKPEWRVDPVTSDGLAGVERRVRIIGRDVVNDHNPLRHDPTKLATALLDILTGRTEPPVNGKELADGFAKPAAVPLNRPAGSPLSTATAAKE